MPFCWNNLLERWTFQKRWTSLVLHSAQLRLLLKMSNVLKCPTFCVCEWCETYLGVNSPTCYMWSPHVGWWCPLASGASSLSWITCLNEPMTNRRLFVSPLLMPLLEKSTWDLTSLGFQDFSGTRHCRFKFHNCSKNHPICITCPTNPKFVGCKVSHGMGTCWMQYLED